MIPLLDPRNDIVFKLFFSKEKNQSLLIAFLETIIRPISPIKSLQVLNPNLPKDLVDDKASIPDLVIELVDKQKIDIEMQMNPTSGFRSRIQYFGQSFIRDSLRKEIIIKNFNRLSQFPF